MIPEAELEFGRFYEIESPSYSAAVWTGESFIGPVLKDGRLTLLEEFHYDRGLPYGVCRPIREIGSFRADKPFSGRNFAAALEAMDDLLIARKSSEQ